MLASAAADSAARGSAAAAAPGAAVAVGGAIAPAPNTVSSSPTTGPKAAFLSIDEDISTLMMLTRC